MRFLMTTQADRVEPADERVYTEVAAFIAEMSQAGVLLATGGLDAGTHISATDGKVTVTDGPFAESKEAIVSFALVEVRSLEEVIEISRRFWAIIGNGEGNVQQVFGPAD